MHLFLATRGQWVDFPLRTWVRLAGLSLINNAAPFTLIAYSEQRITGGTAALINATVPMMTVVTAHYLTHDEKFSANRGAGVVLGALGVGVLIGGDAIQGLTSDVVGELVCFGAAVLYSFSGVYARSFAGLSPLKVATGQVTMGTLWTLPLSPAGNWQTFAPPTAIGAPGASQGNLVAWAQPGTTTTPQLWEITPGVSAASFLPPQPPFAGSSTPPVSWGWFGGDPGAHRSAAGFECASNADCAAAGAPPPRASCILNRCVGVCQTGDDCGSGQGCVMGQCEACAADVSCGTATPKCSAGVCYANVGAGACSVNADCLASQICVEATCVAATKPVTSVLLPSWSTARFVVGTEGTPYSFIVGSGTAVQAWDKTTLGTTLATLSSWPGMTVNMGSYVPEVVRLGANAYDTLFVTDSFSGLSAIPGVGAPATGGTNYVQHTVADGFGGTMSFTGGLAQGVSIAKDGVNPRPTFFGYQQNRIYAFDAQDAAAGTLGAPSTPITAIWSSATGCDGPSGACEDNFGPVVNPLLVGSDGTVYHLRGFGEVQAWDPNGLFNQPATNGTHPGSMLWEYQVPTPWSYQQIPGARPAIFKGSGHDTIWFCNPTSTTLAFINVSPAGASGYTNTSAQCNNGAIVIDAAGYALVANGTTITLVSPAGAIAAQLTGMSIQDGTNVSLANDGIAYLVANGPSGQELTAVLITPTHGLTLLWQVTGVAGTAFDSPSFPILVPPPPGSPPGTTAHVLADYPGGSGQRYWSSFTIGTSTGLMGGGAWSSQGGDNQHRMSLKSQ
ncbi:MAG: DMT family transporter [Myxococcales bacterium]